MKALKLILAATTFASLSAHACAFSEGNINVSKAAQEQKIANLTGSVKPALTMNKPQATNQKGVR